MVDPGDWTGPGGAHQILARRDVDVAVLETARGGIVLRGIGYESNDASVLTNVSSDHLDLQGIHTLPELAEVKSTICRITRPDGWVVLNADDPLSPRSRAGSGRGSRCSRCAGDGSPPVRRHRARGGRAYLVRDGGSSRRRARAETAIVEVGRVPITIGGLARHNVANALAAAGGARGLGATIAQVRDGLVDFAPDADRSPGRLNLFRLGARVVIVDFAHNEAGVAAVLDVAEGIAGGAAGRAAPITAIIGTAGDRPDDTLRGIGRIAAERAQRVAIKQTLALPARPDAPSRWSASCWPASTAGGGDAAAVPIYETETEALRAELNGGAAVARAAATRRRAGHRADVPRGPRAGVRPARRPRGAAGGRRLGADRPGPAAPGSPAPRLTRRPRSWLIIAPARPPPAQSPRNPAVAIRSMSLFALTARTGTPIVPDRVSALADSPGHDGSWRREPLDMPENPGLSSRTRGRPGWRADRAGEPSRVGRSTGLAGRPGWRADRVGRPTGPAGPWSAWPGAQPTPRSL